MDKMATDVKKLVSEMTLEEKAGLLGGADFWHTKAVERLGIPKFMMSDGPHGLRKQDEEGDHLGINDSIKAVCFPAACATAASFDTEMIGKMGEAIGDECQAENLSIVLGPAVNIKRSPLCGRNMIAGNKVIVAKAVRALARDTHGNTGLVLRELFADLTHVVGSGCAASAGLCARAHAHDVASAGLCDRDVVLLREFGEGTHRGRGIGLVGLEELVDLGFFLVEESAGAKACSFLFHITQ